jgi:hypothetical protein
MKKNSTMATGRRQIFKQPKRTIGLDLGDRSSHYCILDEAGNVTLEHNLHTDWESSKSSARFRGVRSR